MAGHLLATVNPSAIDQIGGSAATLPGIGSLVVYVARNGEGRAGKTEFPAIVMHHEPDGHSLYLLVIYDVDDQVTRPSIRAIDESGEGPAWKHVTGAEPEKFEPTRLNIMRKDLDDTRKSLDETREGIYGGYEAPAGSLMEFLVNFEGKLAALAKRLDEMSAPTAKVAPKKGKAKTK